LKNQGRFLLKIKTANMKRFLFGVMLIASALILKAQIIEPIKWSFDSKQNGTEVDLIFKAKIDKGWHLYDTSLPEGGPIATQINFEDSTKFKFAGPLKKSPEPEVHFDSTFQLTLRYFTEEVVLTQKIRLPNNAPVEIKGNVMFMGCNNETCLPPNEVGFDFPFNKPATAVMGSIVGTQSSTSGQTIWVFLLLSLIAGLASILTPCVFPMIPMTVSFFMRGNENKKKSIITAFFFGISITLIFTLLGALFSLGVFGPNVGSILSTHWIPNLIFFILFCIFSVSFFGAFEIVLPSNLVNKTDSKADQGGMIGAFFMALTTVIVSFSCTGPFIGALIIQAVQDGGLRPLLGMFIYGLAFATPFTLLAIFPSALNKLPKSGGWLNSIKVVFAFILLAFGLKFLGNIDQVYDLGLLNRQIFLIIWIVIFFMMGLYLLGKIKFSHDSDLPYLGVWRLILSIATFVFVLFLFTGLFGAPLKSISSLIPPADVNLSMTGTISEKNPITKVELCGPVKFADILHLPNGLPGYFDFDQGLACAREQNKPLFVVFKGHACANCKKMENTVWADPENQNLLAEKFVIVGLYTDDRTKLPVEDQITSKLDGKVKNTIGEKNLDLLISKYSTNSIPFHAIIMPDGKEFRMGVTFDNKVFFDFLKKAL
jgi:thiol:disulfide interchange protein